MRFVRLETGRADEARQASSAGWKAMATGSTPERRATFAASGVQSTTAASRLSTATATAETTHMPPPRTGTPRLEAARAA
jgi:hypothetical protein